MALSQYGFTTIERPVLHLRCTDEIHRATLTVSEPTVFSDWGAEGDLGIFVRNVDGSITNLTNHPSADAGPSLSPDGTRIIFETDRGGDFEIYVMNADGSGQMNLTNNPTAYDVAPVWSSDGSQILFQYDREGERFEYRWYVMDADGSNVTAVE